MMKQNPRPPSLKYAARTIGVSLPTLYKLIAEGKLRTYHIGRAHRASEDAIKECIDTLERESAASPHRGSVTQSWTVS